MSPKAAVRVVVIALTGLGIGLGAMRSQAQPLGTAFTYQGRLTDGGNPATGTYDLRLMLYDAAVGGIPMRPTLLRDDVAVTDGLFMVSLDFGPVFAGSKRWLEIGVRPGASTGAYTTLSPRQELSPSPNAIFSATAPWTGIAGKPAGFADDSDNDVLGGLSCGSGEVAKWNGASWGCAADADSAAWGLAGNAGTNPATHFIGTTDNVPFEVRANSQRALRLEQVTAVVGPTTYVGTNVLAGASNNTIAFGVTGATIAGGGGELFGLSYANRVTDVAGTVGGGMGNRAGNDAGTLFDGGAATVGGGRINVASADASTVAGGTGNVAGAYFSAVAGGESNLASGQWSAVAGGYANTASGLDSVVAGGAQNTASGLGSAVAGGVYDTAGGDYSFAAGRRAIARDATASGDANGDEGTFVWADSTLADFVSTGPNQFLIRAAGGVGVNTNAPLASLHVVGRSTNEGTTLLYPDPSKGTFASHVHYGPNGDWYIRSANANGSVVLQDTGGNVGVGTSVPSAKLHVVGNAVVTGTLSKGAGAFKIDHPLDPENRYLYHSFVESPDMKNIYDGVAVTDREGYATVELPEWFEALNRDFRYQLTVIGQFAQAIVAQKIKGSRFTIRTDKPAVEVSWQVTGIRKDAFAEKHRIPVEQDKPEAERGRCLYPEACGREEEKGIDHQEPGRPAKSVSR